MRDMAEMAASVVRFSKQTGSSLSRQFTKHNAQRCPQTSGSAQATRVLAGGAGRRPGRDPSAGVAAGARGGDRDVAGAGLGRGAGVARALEAQLALRPFVLGRATCEVPASADRDLPVGVGGAEDD